MLKVGNYRTLDRMVRFVESFVDESTGKARTSPLTKIQKGYIKIGCNLMKEKGQRVCTEEILEALHEIVKAFKRMLVDTFEERCNYGLYTPNYQLHEYTVDDRRLVGKLFVFNSSPYDQFNVRLKHSHRWILQRDKYG